jgi:hypothetical protein
MAAISGRAAALAFNEVVVKTKFCISKTERWSLGVAFISASVRVFTAYGIFQLALIFEPEQDLILVDITDKSNI